MSNRYELTENEKIQLDRFGFVYRSYFKMNRLYYTEFIPLLFIFGSLLVYMLNIFPSLGTSPWFVLGAGFFSIIGTFVLGKILFNRWLDHISETAKKVVKGGEETIEATDEFFEACPDEIYHRR